MKNRKSSSSASRNFNFPHPLIKNLDETKIYTGELESRAAPATFKNWKTIDNGTPCPHILRPSTYTLIHQNTPETQSLIDIGLIVQPFACNCHEDANQQSPEDQQPNNKNLSPNNGVNSELDKCWCGVPKGCLSVDSKCGICTRNIDFFSPRMSKGVLDFQIETKNNSIPNKERFIFLIQLSEAMVYKNITEKVLQVLHSLTQCESQMDIGIMLFDDKVYFMDNAGGVTLWTDLECLEEDAVMAPDRFFSSPQSANFTDLLAEVRELSVNTLNKRKSCMGTALRLAAQICPQTQILVFSTQTPNRGKYLIEPRSKACLAPQLAIVKAKQEYFPKLDASLVQLQKVILRQKGLLHLFVFDDQYSIALPLLYQFVGGAGGSLKSYQQAWQLDNLYFDIHDKLSQPAAREVQITVFTSPSITANTLIISNIEFYKLNNKQCTVKLPWLSRHQSFTVMYDIKNRVDIASTSIQISYLDKQKSRRVRYINFRWGIVDDLKNYLLNLGDQALFYVMVRKALLSLKNNKVEEDKQNKNPNTSPHYSPVILNLVQKLKMILRRCKEHSISQYDFSIPASLKYCLFYFGQIYSKNFLKPWKFASYNINKVFREYHEFCTQNITTLSKSLYPKLFRLDDTNSYADKNYPRNIKFQGHRIEFDGLYLVDDGTCLYVLKGEETNLEFARSMLGVSDLNQISEQQHLGVDEENSFNLKINQLVELLRANNLDGYLILKSINDASSEFQSRLSESLFSEDNYKRFLNLLL